MSKVGDGKAEWDSLTPEEQEAFLNEPVIVTEGWAVDDEGMVQFHRGAWDGKKIKLPTHYSFQGLSFVMKKDDFVCVGTFEDQVEIEWHTCSIQRAGAVTCVLMNLSGPPENFSLRHVEVHPRDKNHKVGGLWADYH